MGETVTVGALFAELPHQWGLRGDPHLWAELRDELGALPLPAGEAELAALLESAAARRVGRPLDGEEPIFVARLDHGGMSGGHVDPRWWRAKGFPLLLARYRDAIG